MFCFNEFAFTDQVKHKINSIQILGTFVFYDWPFPHAYTFKKCSLFPFSFLAQFSATVSSFMRILSNAATHLLTAR